MTKLWLAPAVALSVLMTAPMLTVSALAMPSSSPPPAARSSGGGGSDFAAGEKAAKDGDYNQAVAHLEKVVQSDPNNAEAHNYLGFSLRKLGQYDRAGNHYRAALQLKPDFKEAIEYYGELFLATKELPRAEEQLAKLERLCPSGCPARSELESSVKKYKAGS